MFQLLCFQVLYSDTALFRISTYRVQTFSAVLATVLLLPFLNIAIQSLPSAAQKLCAHNDLVAV
jgi:hypothetical protein